MSTFKSKLKGMIVEQASLEFMDNYVDNSTVFENEDPETMIIAAAPLYGMNFVSSEEGVLTLATYRKAALESFTAYLDDLEEVDGYSITVVTSDPHTKVPTHDDTVDYDLVQENDFVEFYIDVAISGELVDYNGYYSDDEDPYDFMYDVGSINDEPFGTTVIDHSFISSDETPLLARLAGSVSNSPYGKFMATIHPTKSSNVLIQVNYSTYPIYEDAMADIDKINSSDFGDKFNSTFSLVSPASYLEDELSSTAAVFESNVNDVTAIVESLESTNKSEYLTELERVVKVNFKGKRRFKMQCKQGFKYDPERKACVLIAGSEKAHMRVARRQMARTKKAMGVSLKRRTFIKVRRAKRFRKMMGI